jgi:hypothetical protein
MGTLIRLTAVLACAIVGVSFALFALDEVDRGSKTQQEALGEELDSPTTVAPPAAADGDGGGVRGAIDDASDTLLAPFTSFVDSGNAWVDHGVPALLGLLLYGVGLGMIANSLPKTRDSDGDWRTA